MIREQPNLRRPKFSKSLRHTHATVWTQTDPYSTLFSVEGIHGYLVISVDCTKLCRGKSLRYLFCCISKKTNVLQKQKNEGSIFCIIAVENETVSDSKVLKTWLELRQYRINNGLGKSFSLTITQRGHLPD